MKKCIAALFFVSIITNIYSQKTDSILRTLSSIKDQTVLTDSLLRKADYFRRTGMLDDFLSIAQEALKVAKKTNKKPVIARVWISVGNAYLLMGKYKEAVDACSEVLKIPADSIRPYDAVNTYNMLGSVSLRLNKQDEAIEYFKTGIAKANELPKNKVDAKIIGLLARFNSNIGVVYAGRGDFRTAVDYFEKTTEYFRLAGDSITYAASLSNTGAAYFYLNEYDKALKNYFASRAISLRFNDKENITRVDENIGSAYIKQGKFAQAQEYLNEGLAIATEMKNKDLERMMYKSFYDLYVAKKDPASALSYYLKYDATNDSLLNESNMKQMNELNTKFETEKKEKEIELLNKEKQVSDLEIDSQKSQRNVFIIGFALVVVLLGFLAFSFIQKSRNNKLLEEKNKLITLKNHTIEEKNKEIIDSITYAKRIQSALLASDNLLRENLKDYFVLFMPKDIVSGDFYWASPLKNGTFALVVADSTGHGVPGAFMSLLNITFLNEAINEKDLNVTGEILTHTRRKIIGSLAEDGSTEGGKDGMDCTLTGFDFVNKVLHYSCAYNPVWIVRANPSGVKELIELEMDKMPVGKHDKDHVPFSSHRFELQTGDVVYSLTDGYADQFGGPKGKKFKYKPLQDLLKSIAGLPMKEQQQILQKTFIDWRGELEQVDDVCISGVRIS
ncbi:MAG: yrrB 5 [Bacteroidetes bacterium]|jgi:serine phosphatase RsbU (regulator of sigma subunit)/lipopolysaccharide biosynthesis regulator YciM|nr:yrrB 5 [Bacteroidota bacterium]